MQGFGLVKKRHRTKMGAVPKNIKDMQRHLSLRWPRSEYKQEPRWLQDNLNFLQSIEDRLYKLFDSLETQMKETTAKVRKYKKTPFKTAQLYSNTIRELRIVRHVKEMWPGAIEMTKQWARHINAFAWSASYWKGNLRQFVLTDKRKWHLEWFQQIIADYTGSGEAFDEVFLPLLKGDPNDFERSDR